MSPSIHNQIMTQSFSNIPLCSNIQQSTFPHQPKAGGPPFLSRTGNLRAPAPINSNSFFEIAFFPRCLYLHQKMYIYYFMLYLAESLTGRNYTEGKLLRYFPLWRERVKVANFVCCRQIPMRFGTVWSRMFSSCKGQACESWLTEAWETMLLSWKKGGPTKSVDSWFHFVWIKESRRISHISLSGEKGRTICEADGGK